MHVGEATSLSSLFGSPKHIKNGLNLHELMHEVPDAAKWGNDALFHEKWKLVHDNFGQGFESTLSCMYTNTLWRAVEGGNKSVVDIVLPLCDKKLTEKKDKINLFCYPLYASVEKNQKDMFFYLLQKMEQEGLLLETASYVDQVFSLIVRFGDIDMAKKLLPFTRPKQNRSLFLRVACQHQREDMINLLLPLSNIDSALGYMRARKTLTDDDRWALERIKKAHDEKKFLKENISCSEPAPKRKNKM